MVFVRRDHYEAEFIASSSDDALHRTSLRTVLPSARKRLALPDRRPSTRKDGVTSL